MSNTLEKNCPCPPVEIVAIPGSQGSTGAAGTNGTNGTNAYSLTTAGLTIPATNSTTPIAVNSVAWMSVGQPLFISDGTNLAHFSVAAIQQTPPVVTVKALGNNGDSAPTIVIAAGASVSPGGVQGTAAFVPLVTTSAATGGSQNVTATPVQALAATLTLSGTVGKTYFLFARLRLDYVGATFAAEQVLTLTIRRTNNTAANLSSSTIGLSIKTTATEGAGEITAIIGYTTVGVSDTVQPFVSVSVIPSAGNLQVVEASLSAIELT